MSEVRRLGRTEGDRDTDENVLPVPQTSKEQTLYTNKLMSVIGSTKSLDKATGERTSG